MPNPSCSAFEPKVADCFCQDDTIKDEINIVFPAGFATNDNCMTCTDYNENTYTLNFFPATPFTDCYWEATGECGQLLLLVVLPFPPPLTGKVWSLGIYDPAGGGSFTLRAEYESEPLTQDENGNVDCSQADELTLSWTNSTECTFNDVTVDMEPQT